MVAVVDRARSCVVVRGREWSCAVVRGRAWSCAVVRGRARSCVVVCGRAWSSVVMRGGRAWSSVVMRGGRARRSCVVVCGGRAWSCVVVRGRARSVVRGRAWSCAVRRAWSYVVVRSCAWSSLTAVLPASRPALPCCPLRGQRCRDARKDGHTRGRTTYNTPLNPPGVGWVNFFYPINVIVSICTCVPNLGSIRGSVRKNCLLSLIIDSAKLQSMQLSSCALQRMK